MPERGVTTYLLMNDLTSEPSEKWLESVSGMFRELMRIVASAPVAYVRKLVQIEHSRMLFDEIIPEEIVVSTDLPSIYFVRGRE